MKFVLLVIFLLVVNCKFNNVVDSHGSHYLEKKREQHYLNLEVKKYT